MENVKAKILVIEDEQSVRDAISKILMNYGYRVTAAQDGSEGLKFLDAEGGFDIVFTDLGLPGMSGWDVALAVRKKRPGTPVVLLSGWDINNADERIAQCGVSRVLAKPVRVKELIKVVEGLISNGAEG